MYPASASSAPSPVSTTRCPRSWTASASRSKHAHDVSTTGTSAARIRSGYAEAMSVRPIATVVKGEPSARADSAACVRSSGPAPSRPIVYEATGSPRSRVASPRTTVESSPPLR